MIQRLTEGAAALGVPLSGEQAERFARYHDMLIEANRRMNLTRVPDDPAEAVDRNYLDSIAPLTAGWPEGVQTLIDVGSGAGFPGIPISIARPDIHVVLLDALDKRVGFLRQVIAELGLNAEAIHGRAEDAARDPGLRERFDLAAARAVAPLNALAELLLPFVRPGGYMLALKGPNAAEEADAAANALAALGGGGAQVAPVLIPGRDWAHAAVWIRKDSETPARFPRRAGVPERRPL